MNVRNKREGKNNLLVCFQIYFISALFIGLASCSDITSSTFNSNNNTLKSTTSSVNIIDVGGTQYEMIDLNSGSTFSIALGLNETSQIVGSIGTGFSENSAQMWNFDSNNKTFETSSLGLLSGTHALAYDINDNLQIVGYSTDDDPTVLYEAVYWDSPTSTISKFTNFDDSQSFALGINNSGTAVGYSTGTNGIIAYKGDKSGVTILADLQGINTAWGINENGVVVGALASSTGTYKAVKWDGNGNSTIIEDLTGSISQAQGINDKGEIVGFDGEFSPQILRAFYIDEDGNHTYLGNLGDSNYSDAIAINNNSQIVGNSRNESGQLRGFIWDEENGMQDLGTLGGDNTQAWDINDKGQIVGFSETATGETHAVLWNPINDADITPPELSYSVLATSLWSPNHKMNLVISGVTSSDNEDPNPSLEILVSSNEAINDTGDGNTEEDWKVVEQPDGTFNVYVRAERNGDGTGRVYTIDVTSSDISGNSSSESILVKVEHDKS